MSWMVLTMSFWSPKLNLNQSISSMPRAHSTFNLITLCDKVRVADSAVEFLKQQGILKTSVACKKCHCDLSTVKRREGTGYYYFRCCNCDSMTSIRFLYKYLQYLWYHYWSIWHLYIPCLETGPFWVIATLVSEHLSFSPTPLQCVKGSPWSRRYMRYGYIWLM